MNKNKRFFFQNQNVVRELESKKPQLDDLISLAETLKTDGNRQKLHNKGKLSLLCSVRKRNRNRLEWNFRAAVQIKNVID